MKLKINKPLVYLLVSLGTLILLIGCGGGGGGDKDFVGAGRVSITATPRTIDTADRSLIVIKLSQISDTGISLKIRYSTALEYVPSSASLTANNASGAINPLFNETADGKHQFLVFFLSAASFGPKAEGEIRLQLVGRAALKNGRVAVDADIDDPAIPNIDEFDPADPQFTDEAEASIEVKA